MRDADEIRAMLRGPVNATLTTFARDGALVASGIRAVVERSIANGCRIIILTWGDSLMSLLSDAEVLTVHRLVREAAGPDVLTVACDNLWGLPQSIEWARTVRELGFDLYMARPAEWLNAKGTPDSLADFYRAVAKEMRCMLVGNVPIKTCEMIANEANIVAFKEDAGPDYAHEIQMRWGDRWPLVGGGGFRGHHLIWPHGHCDAWMDLFIRTNAAPAWRYWEALQAGDGAAAWRVIEEFEVPYRALEARSLCGRASFKHAMLEVFGIAPRWLRSPAPSATDGEVDQIRRLMHELGLLGDSPTAR